VNCKKPRILSSGLRSSAVSAHRRHRDHRHRRHHPRGFHRRRRRPCHPCAAGRRRRCSPPPSASGRADGHRPPPPPHRCERHGRHRPVRPCPCTLAFARSACRRSAAADSGSARPRAGPGAAAGRAAARVCRRSAAADSGSGSSSRRLAPLHARLLDEALVVGLLQRVGNVGHRLGIAPLGALSWTRPSRATVRTRRPVGATTLELRTAVTAAPPRRPRLLPRAGPSPSRGRSRTLAVGAGAASLRSARTSPSGRSTQTPRFNPRGSTTQP
jgi:hypothetical protein